MATLKELRLKKGLTQDELAKRIYMTTQNLRNYEKGGYAEMDAGIEELISKALGVEYKYERGGKNGNSSK
jgi:transcriptional regulator with XRE-family HTH domain